MGWVAAEEDGGEEEGGAGGVSGAVEAEGKGDVELFLLVVVMNLLDFVGLDGLM